MNPAHKHPLCFVTDHVQKNGMKVEYCPTEKMIEELYSKPLQGKLFRFFQNMILNFNDKDVKTLFMPKHLHLRKTIRAMTVT